MNGELRSLYIDSNFAKKDASNRYQYDLVGGIAVPENSRVYVDNISFTNTFSEKVDGNSDELYVRTRKHKDLRDPSGVNFNWTYNGVLNDHLLAGTYAIKQHWYYADLTATTWTHNGVAKTITRLSPGHDVYQYDSPTGTEKFFVKIVHPLAFAVDVQLNGQITTGDYFDGTLTLGAYPLVAADKTVVIKQSLHREEVRDMTGTWTFHDGNTIAVSSTIAQNEFTFTSQGQSGVMKLKDSTAHGTRLVSYWRQSTPNSVFSPAIFQGEMDKTTAKIRFGPELTLTPDVTANILNLAKFVVAPKRTVDLTGDWVRSAGNQETLHVANDRLHGHPSMIDICRISILDMGAQTALLAMQKDDAKTPLVACGGVLTYSTGVIAWQGAITETWQYQGTIANLSDSDSDAQHYELQNYHGVKFAESDGGAATVNSTLFDFTGNWVFSVIAGITVDVVIRFQPADDFPYQAHRTDTGALVSTFRIENKKVTFLNSPNGPYGALWGGTVDDLQSYIMFADGATMISKQSAITGLAAATGGTSLIWATDFEMERVANFGTAQATGMTLGAPLNGTFALNPTDETISLNNTGWFASTIGVVTGGNTITYGGTLVLTGAMPHTSVGGTEQTVTVRLAPGRYSNMTQFAAAVTTALDGVFPGSTVTASVSGANLEISSDNGSTNAVEQLCLLTDEQMKSTGELKSANRWLSNADGTQSVATTFTVGPVILPRTVNSAYLVSDTLAGFRDTMGPVPNTRGTVAKISLGNTAPGDFHNESLFRPHLYSTLPSKDISRIDFALTDSRGIPLDLQDSNFSFVVTFSTDHLMM